MLKALIFDFDGLILDTEYPEYLSWRDVYAEFNMHLPIEQWQAGIAKGDHSPDLPPVLELERRLGRAVDREALRDRREAIYEDRMRAESIRPGVLPLLLAARSAGLVLAICSSSPSSWVVPRLKATTGISLFEVIVTGEMAVNRKPAPDLYLSALDRLTISAGEAIAFEDSDMGLRAAKAAQIVCIAVPNRLTEHADLSLADLIVPDLQQISVQDLGKLSRASVSV